MLPRGIWHWGQVGLALLPVSPWWQVLQIRWPLEHWQIGVVSGILRQTGHVFKRRNSALTASITAARVFGLFLIGVPLGVGVVGPEGAEDPEAAGTTSGAGNILEKEKKKVAIISHEIKFFKLTSKNLLVEQYRIDRIRMDFAGLCRNSFFLSKTYYIFLIR